MKRSIWNSSLASICMMSARELISHLATFWFCFIYSGLNFTLSKGLCYWSLIAAPVTFSFLEVSLLSAYKFSPNTVVFTPFRFVKGLSLKSVTMGSGTDLEFSKQSLSPKCLMTPRVLVSGGPSPVTSISKIPSMCCSPSYKNNDTLTCFS